MSSTKYNYQFNRPYPIFSEGGGAGGGMQMRGMPGVASPIPYQDGGYLRQYNLGGAVAQQPLSYQLGGLLKYKRSPVS